MKLGDVVEIRFLDHVSNQCEPMEFKVWGRLSKIDKQYLVVQSWAHPDTTDSDDNTEEFCIVKSTLTSPVRVLS